MKKCQTEEEKEKKLSARYLEIITTKEKLCEII